MRNDILQTTSGICRWNWNVFFGTFLINSWYKIRVLVRHRYNTFPYITCIFYIKFSLYPLIHYLTCLILQILLFLITCAVNEMQANISFIPLCEAVTIDVWIKVKFALDTSLYGHSIFSCFFYISDYRSKTVVGHVNMTSQFCPPLKSWLQWTHQMWRC